VATHQATALRRAGVSASCDRCGLTDGAITISQGVTDDDPNIAPYAVELTLCAFCLAEGIGLGTGFKAPAQLRAWFEVRETAKLRVKANAKSAYNRGYYAASRKAATMGLAPTGDNPAEGEE
jgi:hypothetical protein